MIFYLKYGPKQRERCPEIESGRGGGQTLTDFVQIFFVSLVYMGDQLVKIAT